MSSGRPKGKYKAIEAIKAIRKKYKAIKATQGGIKSEQLPHAQQLGQ
jgi:hypothetical protein